MAEKEIETLLKIWQEFAERQTEEKFILNPDKSRVLMLARGVLENEKNHGFKFCPCRITTGDREKDLKLICPCNFKIQKNWQTIGQCWCSLFVKEK